MRTMHGCGAAAAVIAVMAGAPVLASGDPAATRTPSDREASSDREAERLAARLDAYLGPLAASADFSGIVRIERDGRLVTERRYGFADWTTRAPFADDTLFAGASITKGVLAVLLLDLAEAGALRLDDPVGRILPILADRPGLTIEAVLRHRAGLPRDLPGGADLGAEGVAGWLVRDPARLGPPGEERYSNVGYALLAEVAEAAGGAPFADLAARRVLRPAGMTASHIAQGPISDLPTGAQPHTAGPPPLGVETPTPARVERGASGLAVTVADLARWGAALAARQDTALFAGDDPLGSLNEGTDHGLRYLAAQGSLPGYAAGVTVWPDTGLTVAYAANLFGHPVLNLDDVLRDVAYGAAPDPLPPRPADAPLDERHRRLAGRFEHPAFGLLVIGPDASGQGMRLTMPEREAYWSFYLTPVAQGRLHWRAFDVVFAPGAGGGVTAEARLARDELLLLKRTEDTDEDAVGGSGSVGD